MMRASESEIQIVMVQALRLKFRGALVLHVPNGGTRNPVEAVKLKRQGVVSGVPDLIVALPNGKTVWLEVKSHRGRVSDNQKIVQAHLSSLGHCVAVVKTVDEAFAVVSEVQNGGFDGRQANSFHLMDAGTGEDPARDDVRGVSV